ncbi:hypothetical protein ACH36K_05085 [Clostridium sp. MB05]|uniref:hypothetical protein n=1 Tax=Clostridium sp. MB05 TaxID=3376682 RepID=UPI003982688C
MENRKKIIIYSIFIAIIAVGIYIVYGREKIGNSPRDVVYKFLSSKSIESKIEYIYDYEEVKSSIEEEKIMEFSKEFRKNKFSYVLEQDTTWEADKEGEYSRVKIFKNNENGDYEDNVYIFYLKKVNDSYKIDFEPIIRENKLTLDEFIFDNSNEKKEFKVYAKLDNYNNISLFKDSKRTSKGISLTNEIRDKEIDKEILSEIDKYYSITLKDPVTKIEIQGFLEKGNKTNEYAARYLSTPGFKQLVVEMHPIKNSEYTNKIFKIDSIKSLNWGIED